MLNGCQGFSFGLQDLQGEEVLGVYVGFGAIGLLAGSYGVRGSLRTRGLGLVFWSSGLRDMRLEFSIHPLARSKGPHSWRCLSAL